MFNVDLAHSCAGSVEGGSTERERERDRERDGMRDRPAKGSKRIGIRLVNAGLGQFLAERGPHK